MRFRNTRTDEIVDITPEHAAAAGLLRKHVPPRRGARWELLDDEAPASDEPKAGDVRAWAKAEGLDVPARGNLSAELVERYKAAHLDGDD